ncbi:hypothetical protein C6495_09005 [Candidatus Poribacteria bacterium]|nr:MAG: hypothetical protein C6495_09005 [Candidatus Poribacteria bacterium]
MKKSEIWEGIIILISAVLLLPIWMVNSGHLVLSPTLLKVLGFLQYPIIIVLSVIFVRRLRRVIRAMRDNKNKPGPF